MRRLRLLLCAALLAPAGSCHNGSEAALSLRVIAGFNGPADAATFTKHGGTVVLVEPVLGFVAGTLPPGNVPDLQAEPNVAYVEEDPAVESHPARAQTPPWGVYHIAADYCWSNHGSINGSTGAYTGGSGLVRVRVAVLDTGVQVDHPDLVPVEWGINYVDGNDTDKNGHGTHVAGTIAARNNTEGVVGVAPDVQIVAYKVLNTGGLGSSSTIAAAIRAAADNNCDVINMSLGASGGSTTLEDAVNYAWDPLRNVVLCAAAGNSGVTTPNYPAYYTNCIAVVATTDADVRASFSNYGTWTDLSAPGQSILSTWKSSGYNTISGTSMATPHVVGVAALVWAKVLAQGDASIKTNAYVRSVMEANAIAGPDATIPKIVDPWASLLVVPQPP